MTSLFSLDRQDAIKLALFAVTVHSLVMHAASGLETVGLTTGDTVTLPLSMSRA